MCVIYKWSLDKYVFSADLHKTGMLALWKEYKDYRRLEFRKSLKLTKKRIILDL